jgi:hypothetical protein
LLCCAVLCCAVVVRAWVWEHAGCIYFGGVLYYKVDPTDGQEKLFYNNGRAAGPIERLCPDPNWPANDWDNSRDCYGSADHNTRWLSQERVHVMAPTVICASSCSRDMCKDRCPGAEVAAGNSNNIVSIPCLKDMLGIVFPSHAGPLATNPCACCVVTHLLPLILES